MQTRDPQAAPRPSTPAVVVPGPQGPQTLTLEAPRTARELDALKARRDELAGQLRSVDGRRSKLLTELRQTNDPTATRGLEDRLALLDARQLQLESDLQQAGQQLSSAAAGLITSTSDAPIFGGLGSKQVMALSILSIIFIFFPLATGMGRAIFKRSARPGPPPAVLTETAQRLERLEASVDAIAVEIERVSEGQRFVTKLLAESQPAPVLGAGQRAPETIRGS